MDRNNSYYNFINESLENNSKFKKISSHEVPCKQKGLVKSKSKEQLHLLSISEIMYDNKMNIPENDYLKIMNHLKDLANSRYK